MKQKQRAKVQALLRDAKEKAEGRVKGQFSKDYYEGVTYALRFVLEEI